MVILASSFAGSHGPISFLATYTSYSVVESGVEYTFIESAGVRRSHSVYVSFPFVIMSFP